MPPAAAQPLAEAGALDHSVYVADWGNQRILKFSPDGAPLAHEVANAPARADAKAT